MARFSLLQIERRYFGSLRSAILLSQSMNQRMWFDSPFVCRQIEGIGQVFSQSLVQAGITSLERLEQTDARMIESVRHTLFLPAQLAARI